MSTEGFLIMYAYCNYHDKIVMFWFVEVWCFIKLCGLCMIHFPLPPSPLVPIRNELGFFSQFNFGKDYVLIDYINFFGPIDYII